MNRIVMSFFTLTLVMTPAYTRVASQQPSQPDCVLTQANSPNVRGVRLGMSLDQLVALFPSSSKRREMKDALDKARAATGIDTAYLSFSPSVDATGNQFAGVDSVMAGVNRGRVVDFTVVYLGPTWNSIDEWVAKLAEAYGLPRAQDWVVGPSENPNKILRCKAIEIEAAIQGGGGSIKIRDLEQLKATEGRPNAAEEKKRQEFKPQ